jgi:hypothetical protein
MRPAGRRLVVARFLDGRMVKGTTQDFLPNRPTFHVQEGGDPGAVPIAVELASLKAIFFVKSFVGDPTHVEDLSLEQARGQGRKVRITFIDNEVLAGFAMGFNPTKPGFFLFPADPTSNNSQVFVVNSAVSKLEWV